MPTEDDADIWNCVMGWNKYDGPVITGWHQFKKHERAEADILTHWRHCPPPPEGSEPKC